MKTMFLKVIGINGYIQTRNKFEKGGQDEENFIYCPSDIIFERFIIC